MSDNDGNAIQRLERTLRNAHAFIAPTGDDDRKRTVAEFSAGLAALARVLAAQAADVRALETHYGNVVAEDASVMIRALVQTQINLVAVAYPRARAACAAANRVLGAGV